MTRQSSLKAALARLSEQEALAAEAERIAHIGTFVFDVETRNASRSAEMVRIWGLGEREGPSGLETILKRVHPDDRSGVAEDYGRLLSEGGRADREIRLVMDDGSIRHVHIRGELVHIKERENPVVLGTVEDITERRHARDTIAEQNRRLKDMQSELIFLARQSAMSTMAATMAHELNQPLAALANYTAGLRRALDQNGSDALIREAVDSIQLNALRAGEIIRRAREMARRSGAHREPIDLEQLARESAQFAAIGRDCPTIALHIGHEREVAADTIQIQQVLVNLLKNACEAIEGTVGSITVSTDDFEDGVRLCVSDTGPGLDPEILPALFEARVSTKPHGMGIGLSISRTIIEAHGGRIWAESLDRGARFCFTLPAAPQERTSSPGDQA